MTTNVFIVFFQSCSVHNNEDNPHPRLSRTTINPMLPVSQVEGQEVTSSLLVYSSNRIGLSFRVCQDNNTPTSNADADDHLGNSAWTRGVSQLHGLPRHPVHVKACPYQPRPGEHPATPAVIKQWRLRRGGRRFGCIWGRRGRGDRRLGDLRRLQRPGQRRTHVLELGPAVTKILKSTVKIDCS